MLKLTMHKTSRILLITALMFFVGGCGEFLGFFIAPLIPPKTIQAEHEMTDQYVLIWVDDAYLDRNNHLLRRELTRQLSEHLFDKKAVNKWPRFVLIDKIGCARCKDGQWANEVSQQIVENVLDMLYEQK